MKYAPRKLARKLQKCLKGRLYHSLKFNNKASSQKFVKVDTGICSVHFVFDQGVIQSITRQRSELDIVLGGVKVPVRPKLFPLPHLLHSAGKVKSELHNLVEELYAVSLAMKGWIPRPSLINQLISVQPMTCKIGQVFFLNQQERKMDDKAGPSNNAAGRHPR